MWSISRQRRFYKISALSMIAIGSALLAFSAWGMLKPREMCQDILVIGDAGAATNVLAARQNPCIDPLYGYYGSSGNFILVVSSICLVAFGGAIVGMITRY
jgi:hypothetical protein